MKSTPLVTVFGGSGFVGRYVVRELAQRGFRVRVAVRRPDLAGHVLPMGNVGQVSPVQANVRSPWSVERAIKGADAVVNLVGILSHSGGQNFNNIHAEGAATIARIAARAGIDRLVHVSAIGADEMSASEYARSKAAGEVAVMEVHEKAIIFRPSIIFGMEDGFFNLFASMASFSPVLPLIGGGISKFQPVYVGDVARAIACGIDGALSFGTIYELGGPEVVSFRQCMEKILQITGRKRLLLPVPFSVAMLKAAFLQIMPNPLLTLDQVRLLKQDNIVSSEALDEGRTLTGIGIEGRSLAAILPSYLRRYAQDGQFNKADFHYVESR